MTKRSKEELRAERAEKKAKKEEIQKEEEIQFERDLLSLNNQKLAYLEKRRLYSLVLSDLDGFYIEIDKLTKKSPANSVTELQLEIVNELIEMVKKILVEDELILKVNKFVSAGDSPAYRDVIVILRRLKQGLDRFDSTSKNEAKTILDTARSYFNDRDFQSVKDIDLKQIYDRKDFIDPLIYDIFK
jgi:hypothetical protein